MKLADRSLRSSMDVKRRECLIVREREEARRDVRHPIEQEVSAELPKVLALRLEGEDTAGGSELASIERVEADVGADVVEDVAIAEVLAQPLDCLGLLGRVGVGAMVLIWRGDADGDGEIVDLTTRDRKNRAPSRAKREHHVQRGDIQLGEEPSTRRAKNGPATGV